MQDDGARIGAAYRETLLRDYFRLSPEQDAVCHYTTGAALASIVESGVLWLTNVRFMNDPAELTHVIEMLRGFVRAAEFGIVTRDTPGIDHLRDHVIRKLEERSTRQFILSTSLAVDSSHMWESYARDDGYAIEFHIPSLIEQFDQRLVKLRSNGSFTFEDFSRFSGTIVYDEVMQTRLAAYTIDYLDFIYANPPLVNGIVNPIHVADIVTNVTHVFYAALYSMKGSHHAKEREYRFVAIPDDGYGHVKTGRPGIARYRTLRPMEHSMRLHGYGLVPDNMTGRGLRESAPSCQPNTRKSFG